MILKDNDMTRVGNKLVIKIDKESRLRFEDVALILFFSGNATIYLIGRVFSIVGMSSLSYIGNSIVHCITAIGLLLGLLKQERSFLAKNILFLVFISSLIFINYILNPEIGVWLQDDTYGLSKIFALDGHIFAGGVTAYYIIAIQKDPERIMKCLKFSNILIMIYMLMMLYNRLSKGYFLVEGANGLRQAEYNMSFGYYCAFISTLSYIFWMENKKKLNLIISVLFFTLAVSFGSRGVIVTFALFIISLIWISLRDSRLTRKAMLIVLIVLLTVVLVTFYSEIVIGIQYFLNSIGITNSRTVSILNSSTELLDSNGRDWLWSLGMDMIKNKFPFGYGAFGERITIGNYVRWGYVHNVFMELVLEFGLIGLVFSIYTLYKSFALINNDKNKKWNILFILFFSNCGMLMVSNSFWYCPYFWAAIATGVLYCKELKASKQFAFVE